jgi:hypothetical protein
MSMGDEEVRKAAEQWTSSEREFLTREVTVIELANHRINERTLAKWAAEELARRDAEAAERALPITEEWLRVVMPDRRRSDERIWHSLHIKNDLYETHLLVRHVELSRFWAVLVQALEHDETLTEKVAFGDLKNRGQLLDLLAALKGGEV